MIRKANAQDVVSVAEIYDEVLDYEAANTVYSGWKKGVYPTIVNAENSFKSGTLFVMEEDGVIIGTAIINQIQGEEYKEIDWKIPMEDEYVMVIHTLCIRPSFSGRGKAREFVTFGEEYARKQGCKVMRIDTQHCDKPAEHLYLKLGYNIAGIVECVFQNIKNVRLICFEKQL